VTVPLPLSFGSRGPPARTTGPRGPRSDEARFFRVGIDGRLRRMLRLLRCTASDELRSGRPRLPRAVSHTTCRTSTSIVRR